MLGGLDDAVAVAGPELESRRPVAGQQVFVAGGEVEACGVALESAGVGTCGGQLVEIGGWVVGEIGPVVEE